MLESFCINRKAKAFCVLLQLYIPSEIVRKILFLMLKMEVSVIDVSLLNFLTTFSSAFLRGLFKSFSCSKQYPNSAVCWDVRFCGLVSSVCSGHFSIFIFECENDNIFLGFNCKYTYPEIYLEMYYCPVLNLQLSWSAHVDIIALFLTSICPRWRAQHSEFWRSETHVFFYWPKRAKDHLTGMPAFPIQSMEALSSSFLNYPLPIAVSLECVRIFSTYVTIKS